MILAYGVTHEKWVWDIRGEPGVVDTFAKVYDDDDLIVSFDVVNVQFAKYVRLHFRPCLCYIGFHFEAKLTDRLPAVEAICLRSMSPSLINHYLNSQSPH